jgi:predicted membrane protein
MADEELKPRYQSGNSRAWAGLILLALGGLLLMQHLGMPLPFKIIVNWQIILILIGFISGVRHRFHGGAWLIMMLVGGFFYIDEYYPAMHIHEFMWPIVFIALGLLFILRPHRSKYHNYFEKKYWKKKEEWKEAYKARYSGDNQDDFIDATSILGGIKKNILSKDFKGGDVVNFFGGTELNLSQTDINGRVVLEVTQVFGGTKLIIPSHWDVKTEMISLFSGIEDRRPLDASAVDPNKVLLLKGTSVFGGIDIRSY